MAKNRKLYDFYRNLHFLRKKNGIFGDKILWSLGIMEGNKRPVLSVIPNYSFIGPYLRIFGKSKKNCQIFKRCCGAIPSLDFGGLSSCKSA